MNGIDVYIRFLALRQHFTSDYDYHKYYGKVNCSESSYRKDNRTYYFCERLARQYDTDEVSDYLLASFVMSDDVSKVWIGWVIRNGNKAYHEWTTMIQNMETRFCSDIELLRKHGSFRTWFECEKGRHPLILRMYLSGQIRPETLVILNTLTHFCDILDTEIKDNIWKKTKTFILNYSSFLRFSPSHYKRILE